MNGRGRTSKPRSTRVPTSVEASNSNGAQQGLKHDPDLYMPIATLTRIMKPILPDRVSVDNDAKKTVQACVSEFISFITREANARCHQDSRNTITAEDVISAMTELGFNDYIGPLVAFINKHRALDQSTPHTVMQLPQLPTQVAYLPNPPPPPPLALSLSTIDGYVPSPPHDVGDDFGMPELVQYNSMSNFYGGQGSSNELEFDPFN